MQTQIVPPGYFGLSTPVLRSELEQQVGQLIAIPLKEIYVWDSATAAALVAAGSDDLGIYPGTHGTHFPYIGTGDVKAATTQRKCRFRFVLPLNYVTGQALLISALAGMITTTAGTSATIDFAAFKANGAVVDGVGDLVADTAKSINSLTWSRKEFAITSDGADPLVAGDELDILCTIDVVDPATVTAVIAGFRPFVGVTVQG